MELNERGINLIENELLSKIVHFSTLGAGGIAMGALCKKYDKKNNDQAIKIREEKLLILKKMLESLSDEELQSLKEAIDVVLSNDYFNPLIENGKLIQTARNILDLDLTNILEYFEENSISNQENSYVDDDIKNTKVKKYEA